MVNEKLKENPLITREDLKQSLLEILKPLKNYLVPGGFYLGNSGTHYHPKIAVMETFSRTLWGIAPFIAGGGEYPEIETVLSILKEGTSSASCGYWGECGNKDQRLVEMASIALSLLIAKETFWDTLSPNEKKNLHRWLSFIEERELPPTNWHFFRILVCTAFRALGLPVNVKAEKESFDLIESLYRGDGWYQDGEGGNYDLYNPMGFHFYSLLWAKLAGDQNQERAKRYLERAEIFGSKFSLWFADNGEAIPYGRSLAYRFGAASFFSACAFADLPALPFGTLKEIILENLRQWFSLPVFDNAGLLSIGYGYPNLIMADRYNSPGSPYWGLKAWLVLALGGDHPFWEAKETDDSNRKNLIENKIIAEKIPGFIISKNNEDAQLFTAGNFSPDFEMNHASCKYGKFAYSAKAGFCVSLGNYGLESVGCDSALVLSLGDNYWRERRNVFDVKTGIDNENNKWVSSVWQPWQDVKITTVIICLGLWHLRIHRIESDKNLQSVEGGFSISRYQLPWQMNQFYDNNEVFSAENKSKVKHEALISFPWGASRITAMEESPQREGSILVPAPNLNILYPHAAVPVLKGEIKKGTAVLITAACRGGCEIINAVPPCAPAHFAPLFSV